MGPAVADYDRNGWLDLFVPDTAFSCLYTNLGHGAVVGVDERDLVP